MWIYLVRSINGKCFMVDMISGWEGNVFLVSFRWFLLSRSFLFYFFVLFLLICFILVFVLFDLVLKDDKGRGRGISL